MRITVGSKNQTKIDAVEESIQDSDLLRGAEVVGREVHNPLFGHPIGIDAVVAGAVDRAREAFVDADYSVGIEGGMIAVPQTKSGYMEISICAIYDGTQFHLGMSPGFEWPRAVVSNIIDAGMDGSQAFKAAGLTTQEKIGATQGAISVLTDGKMNRTMLNKLVVMMALIHLENAKHYK